MDKFVIRKKKRRLEDGSFVLVENDNDVIDVDKIPIKHKTPAPLIPPPKASCPISKTIRRPILPCSRSMKKIVVSKLTGTLSLIGLNMMRKQIAVIVSPAILFMSRSAKGREVSKDFLSILGFQTGIRH